MDHIYAAMLPNNTDNFQAPSTPAAAAICLLDHNFSRPPSELPEDTEEGTIRHPHKSPPRRKAPGRRKTVYGRKRRKKSLSSAAIIHSSKADTDSDDVSIQDDDADIDEKDDDFVPVATVAATPRSPERMRSLLAEYLICATAAHPPPESSSSENEIDVLSCLENDQQPIDSVSKFSDQSVNESDSFEDQSSLNQPKRESTEHINTKDKRGSSIADTDLVNQNNNLNKCDNDHPSHVSVDGLVKKTVKDIALNKSEISTNDIGRCSHVTVSEDVLSKPEHDPEQLSLPASINKHKIEVEDDDHSSQFSIHSSVSDTEVGVETTERLLGVSQQDERNERVKSCNTSAVTNGQVTESSETLLNALEACAYESSTSQFLGNVTGAGCSADKSSVHLSETAMCTTKDSVKREIASEDESRVQAGAKSKLSGDAVNGNKVVIKIERDEDSDGFLSRHEGFSVVSPSKEIPTTAAAPESLTTDTNKIHRKPGRPRKNDSKAKGLVLNTSSISEDVKLKRQWSREQTSASAASKAANLGSDTTEQSLTAGGKTESRSRKRTADKAQLDAAVTCQQHSVDVSAVRTVQDVDSCSLTTTATGTGVSSIDVGTITPSPAKLKKLSPKYKTPLRNKVFIPKADTSVDTTLFLIPLMECGWKRELVLRGMASDDVSKKNPPADTYYFTPDGKKLRSRVEIAKYLEIHPEIPLTVENFTFLKKAISQEPYESVRQAGLSTGRKPLHAGSDSSPRQLLPKVPKKKFKIGSGSVGKDSVKTPALSGSLLRDTLTAKDSPTLKQTSYFCEPAARPSFTSVDDELDDESEENDSDDDDDDDEYHPWQSEDVLDWHRRQKGRRRKSKMHLKLSHSSAMEEREVLIQSMPEPDIVIDHAEEGDFDDLEDVCHSVNAQRQNKDVQGPRMMLVPSDIKTESDSDADVIGSVEIHQSPVRPSKHPKTTARKSTTSRTAQIQNSLSQETVDVLLCSNSCPGLDGVAPSLQCSTCMCLFHHQCVGIDSKAASFKCSRCLKIPSSDSLVFLTNTGSSKPYLLTKSAPTLLPPSCLPQTPPLQQPLTQPTRFVLVKSPLPGVGSSLVASAVPGGLALPARPRGPDNMMQQQQQLPTSVSFVNIFNSGPRPPQLTIGGAPSIPSLFPRSLRPSGAAPLGLPNLSCPVRPLPRLVAAPGVPSPAAVAASTRANSPLPSNSMVRPVLFLASGPATQQYQPQLMTLPPSLLHRLDLNQPIVVKMNNTKVVVSPKCVIKSQDGVKVLLPANTFPVLPGSNGNFSVSISNVSASSPMPLVSSTQLETEKSSNTVPSPENISPESQDSKLCTLQNSLVGSKALLDIVNQLNCDSGNDSAKKVHKSPSRDETQDISSGVGGDSTPSETVDDSKMFIADKIIHDVLDDMQTTVKMLPDISEVSKVNSGESSCDSREGVATTVSESGGDSVRVGNSVSASIISVSSSSTVSNNCPSTTDVHKTCARGRQRKEKEVDFMKCSMHRLFGGFDCMLQIFKYLGLKDLLRASLVCRTWFKIARQKSLWLIVHLKGLSVTDWEQAGNFFKNMGTHTLNLQDICHPTNCEKNWISSWNEIDRLPTSTSLRRLKFGLVPAGVLYSLADKLPDLECLHAEHITDYCSEGKWTSKTRLDIGRLSNSLTNLQTLRLRGVGGLALPTFSFDGTLDDLAKLEHLHTLSLTSLVPLRDKDYKFLGELKQLQVLELGDCPNWTADTYKLLGELTQLKHLRLEYGGEFQDIGIGTALLKLQKLERLELILFDIPSSLGVWLQQLPLLKTFVLCPDISSRDGTPAAIINSHALAAVSALQQLQTLVWGVINTQYTLSSLDGSVSSSKTSDNTHATISLLASETSLELDTERDSSEVVAVSLKDFTARLCERLPSTRVIVTVRSSIENLLDL